MSCIPRTNMTTTTMTNTCLHRTVHHLGISRLLTAAMVLSQLMISSGTSITENPTQDQFRVEEFWESADQRVASLEWMMMDDRDDDIERPRAQHEQHAEQQESQQRLRSRAYSPNRAAPPTTTNSTQSRSLQKSKNKKKDHGEDFHWPAEATTRHRMLIRCKAKQNQDDCLKDLLHRSSSSSLHQNHENVIKVIHNLEAIHAISIEVDSETRDQLFAEDDFELHRDFERNPMRLIEEEPESMEYTRRNLQQGQIEPWGLEAINARQVWNDFSVRGGGVKVCILDTGVDASHEDLLDLSMDGYYGHEAISPWYEDRRGHGTHIAGIMGAADNDIGIVGIAPDINVFVVKVFDDLKNFHDFADGTSYSTDLIAAAQVCKDSGADIISASLGGYSYNQFEDNFFRDLYNNDGILTIAAAGNGYNDRNVYPAAYDSVFSVGAIEETRVLAGFSTLNPSSTDILAPGVGIPSTFLGNQYRSFSGTSMAAPHVTGVVALMLSYLETFQPDATVYDIFDVLRDTSVKNGFITSTRSGDFGGIGVVDAYAAVEALAQGMGNRHVDVADDPFQCSQEVHLEVNTDAKGFETAYRLKRLSDGQTIWLEAPNSLDSNSEYEETTCLDGPEACYRFDIRDMGRDGIDGNGIRLYYKGHELYHGGRFGGGGMLQFGSC